MSVHSLTERLSCVPALSGNKEMADWIRSYADHIEETAGDFSDTRDVVLLLHSNTGKLEIACTSTLPRFDTVDLVGLLTCAAARKATFHD